MGEQEMAPPEEEADKEARAASLRAESEALARGVVANVEHERFGRRSDASNAFESELRRTAFKDVDDAAERFGASLALCDWAGIDYPCLGLRGEGLPIPIDFSVGGVRPTGRLRDLIPSFSRGFLQRFVARFQRVMGERGATVVRTGTDESVKFFSWHVTNFIGARLAAPNIWTTGVLFTVHTREPGLRVHYSGKYFIRPDEVFGAPTTPVKRAIRPGIYVFGVYDIASNAVTYSNASFTVPDVTEAQLVEF